MRRKVLIRFAVALVALAVSLGLTLPAGASLPAARPDIRSVTPSLYVEVAGHRSRPRSRRMRTPATTKAKTSLAGHDRDPFLPLVGRAAADLPPDLPPGKAGLIVGRLQLEGLVHTPGGLMAVVSTPHGRVFFLRPGDRLYNGQVTAIGSESASFHEVTRDAYGRPLARTVTLRLHSGGGE